jgi:hypothetical protein
MLLILVLELVLALVLRRITTRFRGRESKVRNARSAKASKARTTESTLKTKSRAYTRLSVKNVPPFGGTALASLPSAGRTRRAVETTSLTELSYARIASTVLSSGDGFQSV